ncbi:MAG: lysophospholipid transporter LplT [Pseudomonadota bacterium]
MQRGFYAVMAAQFFSSFADNALFVVAIALLQLMGAAPEMNPLLQSCFALSYVLFAPVAGVFADSMPKGRAMFITNLVKISGCVLMMMHIHPLFAYAFVGLGAAMYSPAKYGILTELLPSSQLVKANGWIEGLTIGSIVLGQGLGGFLISSGVQHSLASHGVAPMAMPYIWLTAMIIIYTIAALCNLRIPDTGARYEKTKLNIMALTRHFWLDNIKLCKDRLGQISLAVTTLFWGAGATLKVIVLAWGQQALGLNLSQSTYLNVPVALGIAIGAVWAASKVKLEHSPRVIPIGIAMGAVVLLMPVLPEFLNGSNLILWGAVIILLTIIGILAGFFVVPMNALLQHRGHCIMAAGGSIAVQNFNENLSILLMTLAYAQAIKTGVSLNTAIIGFGISLVLIMFLIYKWHQARPVAPHALHHTDHVAEASS